jgi:hypothetical protein
MKCLAGGAFVLRGVVAVNVCTLSASRMCMERQWRLGRKSDSREISWVDAVAVRYCPDTLNNEGRYGRHLEKASYEADQESAASVHRESGIWHRSRYRHIVVGEAYGLSAAHWRTAGHRSVRVPTTCSSDGGHEKLPVGGQIPPH